MDPDPIPLTDDEMHADLVRYFVFCGLGLHFDQGQPLFGVKVTDHVLVILEGLIVEKFPFLRF